MTSNPKTKERNFQSSLKSLETAMKDVMSFSKIFMTMEDLQSQNKELKGKLEDAHRIIEEHQSKICTEQRRNEDFADKISQIAQKWAEEKKDLQTLVEDVKKQSSITAQKRENELNKRVEAAERALHQSQRKLDKQGLTVSRLESTLKETELQLKELEMDTMVHEIEKESILNKFRTVEDRLKDLTEEFFESTLISSDSIEVQEPRPTQFTNAQFGFPLISYLPNGNLEYPRPAFAQSVIAERLVRDIFISTYLNAPSGRTSMGEFLQRSSGLRPRQKAILRSLLTNAFQTEEERLQTEALETAFSITNKTLESLCRPERLNDFRQSLYGFLRLAADVWCSVRKSSFLFHATIAPAGYPGRWRYSETHNTTDNKVWKTSSCKFLVLFPHIFDEQESQIFYDGLLWVETSDSNSSALRLQGHPPLRPEKHGAALKAAKGQEDMSLSNAKTPMDDSSSIIGIGQQASRSSRSRSCSGTPGRSNKNLRRNRHNNSEPGAIDGTQTSFSDPTISS
ncbi:uncharacterized protein BO80DRAFT_419161 [Aspergillus ibericus CBS 121593]|uniref:Uncharacterized protein n=1 Tax=Aspergillus ibericus CBS 121593 TaxID=1448316 RepID=A0A395GIQ9_9EURO|nr:hypothetical protein BO80DRAFT_419161 [Aspergillus ibericus CBS 121593]RAK95351.1 hypothetical protein BO80DRAFT_419161 [Aspergillus ibericus CBS 121593]